MFLLVVCPLVLILDVLLFLSLRGQRLALREEQAGARNPSAKSRKEWFIYGTIVVAAQFPLLGLLPIGSTPVVLWGDAESHARVGYDIARFGLQTGWLDGRLAGFPFAQHYPPLGWLLHAAALKFGASPIRAMQWLGFLFVFATPLTLFYCLGSAPRIRLLEAALAGVFVSWISPYSAFFGGYEAFFHTGLLSQTIGVPLVMLWMREICFDRRTPALVGYSLLAMTAHPQVCIAAVVFLGIGLIGFGAWSRMRTYVWATLVLGAWGLALYGKGVLGMQIPFGWPPDFGWRQQGFSMSRLSWWLMDGSLFDRGSAGGLTSLTILAGALSLSRLGIPEVRAATLTFTLGLLLSVSGSVLGKIGPVGELLLRFVQPLRLVSLIPLAAAALIAIATGAVVDDVVGLLGKWQREKSTNERCARGAKWALCAGVFATCLSALPARLDFVQRWHESFREVVAPGGYERALVASWLAEKRPGRIWYSAKSRLVPVFLKDALSLATESPLGNTGAIGGHVGLHLAAYGSLSPEEPGAQERAKALGVRSLLLVDTPTPPGFRVIHKSGTVTLVEQDAPAGLLGSGCIARKYVGPNADLMARMAADLKQSASRDRLLDPNNLTQVVFSKTPLAESSVPKGECESESVRIRETAYYSGHIAASLESPHPFDLVLRVASFSSWQITLDGKPKEWNTVGPGFISLRIPAGIHSFSADANVWRNMLGTLSAACLLLLCLVFGRSALSLRELSVLPRRK